MNDRLISSQSDEVASFRGEMICELIPMAKRIAYEVSRFAQPADYDDCIGDALLGVIRAVDSFRPEMGVRLRAYAHPVIMGSVFNGIRQRDPISEVARRKIRQAERERFACAQELARLPSMQEMESSIEGLASARVAAHRFDYVSLDEPTGRFECATDDGRGDPGWTVAARDSARYLYDLIESLPPRLGLVLKLRYVHSKSMKEIGEQLRLTPQRVSQLHKAALCMLRDRYDP